MMPATSCQTSNHLIQQWWQNCSSTACTLPQEYTQEWIGLISTVVRNFRLLDHCNQSAEQRYYRGLCKEALAKARWELMLISMYGYIPQPELNELEKLQNSLEKSLDA